MDLQKFEWQKKPSSYAIGDNRIEIVSKPYTDLWQKTYYHFQNDNAPVLQTSTTQKFFSFVVKTDFSESHHRFDQCGIVMYLDSEHWIKASTEYDNENDQHLGSVVTNEGYSDWATTTISADIKSVWYRLSRRVDDYRVESSFDGIHFTQMRIFHMTKASDLIKFGVYACSPENSSFKSVFTNLELLPCQWPAHNGQKPDNK
ncbi:MULTISPECIES: DUF1349 domain-containing protein [Leuconostoc]|uniref:DUF1349 domain-containing protein n=2 Tax=Leuconostoc kimchii TaxID=136609 RepID=D5T099_LEUKI|nr:MULTISPECIES: DUF1349 domain-containing protein [Leuconostoc]ADG39698.1 hypothetical protein LKI_00775 [Leuconostoc kimchii IMSNU 11154]AEJ30441.1 hypothetical protein LGMK_01905 [Leuconostoc sp. C2]QBR47502.1 DUF1349 domain-containing protein [Leuconostoc kimchii]